MSRLDESAGEMEECGFFDNSENSPTLSFTFENFYIKAKAKEAGLASESVKAEIENCNSGCSSIPCRLEMINVSKPEKKNPRQHFLRLVDGRLQTVGFSTAKSKSNSWRDVVDSMFR